MIKTVLNTINEHKLIKKGDRVLLALSGGSDSVCLLHVLCELQQKLDFELFACHLNHAIREEADSDAEFVLDLCNRLNVKCFIKKAEIPKIAAVEKISEELAGRNERYKFFEEVSAAENINLIATAHNKNDVAETILMHLIRGAGLDGLTGIAYKRGNIIRPLLDAKKEDIENFCTNNKFSFVTDKTNSEAIYTRNKIRLELLPKICKDFNPAFTDVLVKNAKVIKNDADFLDNEAENAFKRIAENGRLTVSELQKLHSAIARRVIIKSIRECLKTEQNVQSVYVESILGLVNKGKSGSSVNIGENLKCVIESGYLFYKNSSEKPTDYCYRLELNKKVYIKEADVSITLKEWSGSGEKFYFDNTCNIYVRNRRRGDVFYPLGMNGKKKLSDYFTDCKIPISERNILPIITYGDDLVWIIGKRRDSRFIKGRKAYTFIID